MRYFSAILQSLLILAVLMMFFYLIFVREPASEAAFSSAQMPHYVLVIDAGHGGEDGGASTHNAVPESEINLAIATRLDSLLAFYGVNTVMTRRDDRSLHDGAAQSLRDKKNSDLKNRVALIEETPSAFLLSIHQNAFPQEAVRGFQAFYRSEETRAAAERLQAMVQQSVDPQNDRSAKAIPETVYLLEHVSCPAVLVECGFLSNREEAELLESSAYQTTMSLVLTQFCLTLGTGDV